MGTAPQMTDHCNIKSTGPCMDMRKTVAPEEFLAGPAPDALNAWKLWPENARRYATDQIEDDAHVLFNCPVQTCIEGRS